MPTKPKAVPQPASKPTPKVAQKITHKMTPATQPKDNKVAAKVKIAPKIVETPEPKAASKTVAKVVTKQEPKTASKIVKPETKAKVVIKPKSEVHKKVSPAKADSKPVVHKPDPKAEIMSVAKAAPPVAPKIQKWQEIRIILEKIKEDTLREISKSVKNGTDAVTINEPGGDIYDQASSERDRELGLLLGDREREKLHSIDEALLRIAEDEYGICEECEDDIPLGRLKAMPFTRHCVKCKSDLEKLQAQTKRFEEDRAYREIPLGSEEEEA